jgi:SnoaL-like domain
MFNDKSKGRQAMKVWSIMLVAGCAATSLALAADPMKLPPNKKQPSVQKVVDEHVDALNKCDWNRLMAQYPDDVEIHLPDGQVIKGRQKVGDLFAGFCKPRPDGLKGLKFTPESSFRVGDTLNVQWRAEADFLAEPYKGSDAYVTRGGLMAAQVTTFDGTKLKFKK